MRGSPIHPFLFHAFIFIFLFNRFPTYALQNKSGDILGKNSESDVFDIVASIQIENIDGISCGVIDSINEYAYWCTNDLPAQIIKVDTNSMSVESTIALDIQEGRLKSAIIDSINQKAYFAANGIIIEINLRDFTRERSLQINGSGEFNTSIFYPQMGYAFFGSNNANTFKIFRIRITDFSLHGSITIENVVTTAVIDTSKGYAYFGTIYQETYGTCIIIVDLHGFKKIKTMCFTDILNAFIASSIDITNQVAIFATEQGGAIKVDLNNMKKYDLGNYSSIHSVLIESNYAYFGSDTGVIRRELTNATNKELFFTGKKMAAVLDPPSASAFFSNSTYITQIQLSAFCNNNCSRHGSCINGVCLCYNGWHSDDCSLVSCPGNLCSGHGSCVNNSCQCDNGWDGIDCSEMACPLNCNGHGSCNPNTGKCSCQAGWLGKGCEWGIANSFSLDIVGNVVSSVVDWESGFAYFGTDESPGRIIKVNLNTFTAVANFSLQRGESCLRSAVIDSMAGYAYFGTDTAHGIIVKVNLANFSREDTIYLSHTGQDYLTSAVIDTKNKFAYFGTNAAFAAQIIRINLSPFAYQDSLLLNKDEDYLTSAIIDTDNGFAYFGTSYEAAPGNSVIKINLHNFTRVERINFHPSEYAFTAALIDKEGYGYFATDQEVAKVIKVNLKNMTIIKSLEEGSYIQSAVISDNYAYFGAQSQVVRINLQNFQEASTLNLDDATGLMTAFIDTPSSSAVFASENILYQVQLYGLCPNNCSRNGECVNGICQCVELWGGFDCSEYIPPYAPLILEGQSLAFTIFFYVLAGSYIIFIPGLIVQIISAKRLRGAGFHTTIIFYVLLMFVCLVRMVHFLLGALGDLRSHIWLCSVTSTIVYYLIFLTLLHSIYQWINLPIVSVDITKSKKSKPIFLILIVITCLVSFILHSTMIFFSIEIEIRHWIIISQTIFFGVLVILIIVCFFIYGNSVTIAEISRRSKKGRKMIFRWNIILGAVTVLELFLWFACERTALISQTINQDIYFWGIFIIVDIVTCGVALYLAYKYAHFYKIKHHAEKSLLVEKESDNSSSEDSDDESNSVAVNYSFDRKQKKICGKGKISFAVAIVLLIGFGIAIYFLFPRYPTMKVDSINFQKFQINSDSTASIDVDITLQIKNDAYAHARLQNISFSLSWTKYILGRGDVSDIYLSKRDSSQVVANIYSHRVRSFIGLELQQAIQKAKGYLELSINGTADARAMGFAIKINIFCTQRLEVTKVPFTIAESNCIYDFI